LNALAHNSNVSVSDGNLEFTKVNAGWDNARSTIGMSSGKWYCEVVVQTGTFCHCGILKDTTGPDQFVGQDATSWGYSQDGGKYNNSVRTTPYGDTFTTGDLIGIAFDADAGDLYFYKNGVVQNSGTAAYTGLTDGPYFFATSASGSGQVHIFNFGQRPFTYTPPTNYVSLCTQNLSDPTIADGSTEFDVITATGTAADRTFTMPGGFGPDLVWAKERNGATNHALFDTLRGATKRLVSNSTQAEDTQANQLKSFTSTGFTYGSDIPNNTSQTGVYWCWDAGDTTTTVAKDANGTNLPGATCEYRANTTNGFSVVKVDDPQSNEARVHGLGVAPDFFICKSTASADSWHTYWKVLGRTYYINLNGTGGATSSDQFGSQEPDSTYFYVKANTGSGANKAGGMVYYLWSAVDQYSAFGSYTGNGLDDGTFVFTGFKIAYLLIKQSSGSNAWIVWDNARQDYNVQGPYLQPQDTTTEGDADYVDFLSNGFKWRTTNGAMNASGATYLYAAFAEHPFKTARAR